jgi:hypothetical protein
MWVVAGGELYLLKEIVAKGDINAEFKGETALYRAVEKEKLSIVRWLAEEGADINADIVEVCAGQIR